jgi:hypothetical protein
MTTHVVHVKLAISTAAFQMDLWVYQDMAADSLST